MILHGAHTPKRAHDDTTERVVTDIQAEGTDYETAKAALYEQVPDGAQLLYIRRVERN